MNDSDDASDPLLNGACVDDQLVDDLHNWEYYTENFDCAQGDFDHPPVEESLRGSHSAPTHSQACVGNVNSKTRHIRSRYQVHDNIIHGESEGRASSWPALVPYSGQANAAQPTHQTLEASKPQRRTSTPEAFTECKQDTSDARSSATMDDVDPDDTSPINFSYHDSQPHPSRSDHGCPTNHAAHTNILNQFSMPFVPAAAGVTVPSEVASVAHGQNNITQRPASPLSLLRQQSARLKPLSGYNYFFRDERNNIVSHMRQLGDALPDPVSDFSSGKMEQLLHEHWYVQSATVP
jgi:hypothetical protein